MPKIYETLQGPSCWLLLAVQLHTPLSELRPGLFETPLYFQVVCLHNLFTGLTLNEILSKNNPLKDKLPLIILVKSTKRV